MDARFENQRVIVTGAGSGIGRAIAIRFAAGGAHVALVDIDEKAVTEVAEGISTQRMVLRADVTNTESIEATISRVVDTWGGLDVMVNNAGVGVAGSAPETSEKDLDRVLNVNLKGTFLGIKFAVPPLTASGGGSIVNLASVVALVGVKNRAAYSASKGGVLALTRSAAIDHVKDGVRVNCVAPGTVNTPWLHRINADSPHPERMMAEMQARQPNNRLVEPEEIAASVAYLASEDARSITGTVITVDGGMTAA